MLLSLVAACGGSDAAVEDTDAGQSPAPAPAAAPTPPASGGQQTLSFNFGSVRAVLSYGAASVGGRSIIGGVVPYGQRWTLGDGPTTLQLSAGANVGGIGLEAGTYTLSAIPSQAAWQFFINSGATEVGTFNVTPSRTPALVETLTYQFEPAAGGDPGGELVLEWENTLLLIPIEA
jgi:hypothetical protein